MPTIEENLTTLAQIKADIKTSIINKGVDAGDDITLYGDKIRNISGGSGAVDNTDYLCFEALEDSAVSLNNFKGNTPDIEYSFNKQNWTQWNYSNMDIMSGQKIYFRGDNPNGFSKSDGTDDGIYSQFSLFGSIIISGNFMTLISKNGQSNSVNANCFNRLFDCQSGTDAMFVVKDCNAILPATTLGKNCYRFMFSRNLNMKHCPALPATTLAENCYLAMFYNCNSISEAPYLPAKTLPPGCYNNMFRKCSSLQYIKADYTGTTSTRTSLWV